MKITKKEVLDCIKPGEMVIGIDPGDTTGVVWLVPSGAALWGSLTPEGVTNLISRFMGEVTYAMEDYIQRPSSVAGKKEASRIIGRVQHQAQLQGGSIVLQQVGIVKNMIPTTALNKDEWRWHTDHERDALRHAVYYLLTR